MKWFKKSTIVSALPIVINGVIVPVAIFIGGFAVHSATKPKEYGDILISKVIRVYDGDTFFANIDAHPSIIGDTIGIRINGIDAPEIKGKCDKEKELAVEAKELLEDLLVSGNKTIVLKNIQRGKYFRIVADVYVSGRNVAKKLIREDLAVEYDGGTKTKDWCE